MNYFLDTPQQTKISLTNVCNYRCVMCYNPNLKQERGFIDDALLYRVLDQCAEIGVSKVSLGATGEPLLHKHFLEYVRYAKSLGLWVSTTSNCSTLTHELASELIEAGLDRFNISIYSSCREEHLKYTGNDCFDQVLENVTGFLRLWHRSDRRMHVNMWFLKIPQINDYDKYLEVWKPLADEVGLPLPLKEKGNWAGKVDFCSTAPVFLERSEEHLRLAVRYRIRCPHIRYYLQVLHNGQVLPCCNIAECEGHEEILFGNAKEDSLMSIWQSRKYLRFKKDHAKRRISAYPLCRNCADIRHTTKILLSPRNLPQRLHRLMKSIVGNRMQTHNADRPPEIG